MVNVLVKIGARNFFRQLCRGEDDRRKLSQPVGHLAGDAEQAVVRPAARDQPNQQIHAVFGVLDPAYNVCGRKLCIGNAC